MTQALRKSENEKLQAIMNALLLPVPGVPATGTKRFREPGPAVAAAASLLPVTRAEVLPDMAAAPVLPTAPAKHDALPMLPTRRRSLFVAPVELASPEAAPSLAQAAHLASELKTRGPLFAAAVEQVELPLEAASLSEAVAGPQPSVNVAAKELKATEKAQVFASAISEVLAAVLELTVVEPMRDAFASFDDAMGENERKTTQRGRAGKMPKVGRATRTAKTSMAMATRDARRLSLAIAAARAEEATKDAIDALRSELLSTRRRCASPAYAKALREALPIVLPSLVPLGFTPALSRPDDLDPPAPPASRDARLDMLAAIVEQGRKPGIKVAMAAAGPLPAKPVSATPPSPSPVLVPKVAKSMPEPTISSAARKTFASWKRGLAAMSFAMIAALVPGEQAALLTAEAELIAPPGIMTGALGAQGPAVAIHQK